MDFGQIKHAIRNGDFTTDQYRELFAVVKTAHRAASYIAAGNFSPKDKVTFTGRRGVTYKGEVVKVKIKNVLVLTTDGTKFNVPASMLKPLQQVA